ncbi:Papain-like cysteine protease [Giardia duodenalis]|uniref:Papain-like cysteine protease n=1 Tax=Giardia intestinalis TaxID=5741 RepID=V6TPZ3_GIAIN|nr:Papain-like cysteine protease [Giardia intestinalis]
MSLFCALAFLWIALCLGQPEHPNDAPRGAALFDEFNAHFDHLYKSSEEYETAQEHFHRNLALLNASHAQNVSHLRSILERTEGMVTYGLNPTLNRDISQNGYIPVDPADIVDAGTPWDRLLLSLKRLFFKFYHSASASSENSDEHCERTVYQRDNPLGALASLPPSVDLRELGLVDLARNQGVCGCCWAMASAAFYEISVRSTRSYFQSDSTIDDVFKDPHFQASEQYIMNKSNQTNNYCQGGSYLSVSRDYAVHQTLDTLESLTNFPFESIDISTNPANIDRDTKRKVKNAFLPGDTVNVDGCPAAIFRVYDKFTTYDGFEGSIDVVKSLLARGIPVVITMSTVADGSETPTILQAYKSGILDIPCNTNTIDHQVIIVGYGKKNGVDVWVVRNSWGATWGSHGHFYVPIGKNSLCTEQELYAEIPKYFPLSGRAANQLYADRASPLTDNVWSGILQRGNDDSLDVDPVLKSMSPKSIAIVVPFVLLPVIVAVIALTSYIFCCKKKNMQLQGSVNLITSTGITSEGSFGNLRQL